MQFEDFRAQTIKLNSPKKFSIRNSYGNRFIWRYLVKNKKIDPHIITESKFGEIIKETHKAIIKYILDGHDIKLPHGMGTLEIRKRILSPRLINNRLANVFPVDWGTTLKLWYQDEKARENKTLVRQEGRVVFKVYYNKKNAQYANQVFYKFTTARGFKLLLKQRALDNNIDSLLIHKQ